MRAPIVTLLTDFGTADGYVGALKGVILSRCPEARIVDLAHELAPGDVAGASFALAAAAPHFPAGTVHVAVVDPGVGTARRGLALELGGQLYVGPDNGIFAAALADAAAGDVRPPRVFALENAVLWRAPVSRVFHGRDVFAPVAAHLASGGALEDVGPALAPDALVRLAASEPLESGGALRGAVVHVDRFGNLITNLRPAGAAGGVVELDGRAVPLVGTYADAAPGALVALVGSTGRLELAVNGGSAARVLGSGVGRVVVFRAPREPA